MYDCVCVHGRVCQVEVRARLYLGTQEHRIILGGGGNSNITDNLIILKHKHLNM